jgi:TonB family protein
VSGRTATALLALLTLSSITKPMGGAAQQAQDQAAQNPAAQNQVSQNQAAQSNEEFVRRAKSKVQPVYPDLARKMNISGTVKVQVVVLPNGTVKEARVVGGHPVLASAALDAAKKWRFEPAPTENTGIIDFKFEPR